MAMQPSKSVSSESTNAPFASGCTSWAVETFPEGSSTATGRPAAAPYAASDAEVSPVDAQAIALTLRPCATAWRTTLTSTVIPRSLKEPVWLLPHILTQSSSQPSCRPYRSAQKRLVPPSSAETMSSSDTLGATHSRFPQTPDP